MIIQIWVQLKKVSHNYTKYYITAGQLASKSVVVEQLSGVVGVGYCVRMLPWKNWLWFSQLLQLENTLFNHCPDLTVELKISSHFALKVHDHWLNVQSQGNNIHMGGLVEAINHQFCLLLNIKKFKAILFFIFPFLIFVCKQWVYWVSTLLFRVM